MEHVFECGCRKKKLLALISQSFVLRINVTLVTLGYVITHYITVC